MSDVILVILLVLSAVGLVFMAVFVRNYQRTAARSEAVSEKLKTDYDSIAAKYKPIIDIDSEVMRRRQTITELGSRVSALQSDYQTKSQALNANYTRSKKTYDELVHQLALVEETLDIQEYGLYKPHYDYTSSEEYKRALDVNYELQRGAIKNRRAAICTTKWTVSDSRRAGEKMVNQNTKLILRAFNGECDSAVAKVSWNNVRAMEERIKKTFETINRFGTTLQISITNEYLDLKLQELRLAFEYEEKRHQEREEQRRIQEQIREEERAQREMEKVKQDAEDEERRYQKALEKARTELETAKGREMDTLQSKISDLESRLKAAQELKKRAISQAQLTRSGHVYVISNVGSFGENVFKIGMTRRLEPLDRIKELGDASVPFHFDIHAMVYSDNAPELERKLHEYFEEGQINLINDRKEFFNTSIEDVEKFCRMNNLQCTVMKVAEAREYRQSIALKGQRGKATLQAPLEDASHQFPDSLI